MNSKEIKSTIVLHIGQPVKIVVVEPDWVIVAEQFYNGKRMHSTLSYQSPLEFEREFYKKRNLQNPIKRAELVARMAKKE